MSTEFTTTLMGYMLEQLEGGPLPDANILEKSSKEEIEYIEQNGSNDEKYSIDDYILDYVI